MNQLVQLVVLLLLVVKLLGHTSVVDCQILCITVFVKCKSVCLQGHCRGCGRVPLLSVMWVFVAVCHHAAVISADRCGERLILDVFKL